MEIPSEIDRPNIPPQRSEKLHRAVQRQQPARMQEDALAGREDLRLSRLHERVHGRDFAW